MHDVKLERKLFDLEQYNAVLRNAGALGIKEEVRNIEAWHAQLTATMNKLNAKRSWRKYKLSMSESARYMTCRCV